MDEKYIEENLMIERYVKGELSQEEQDAFEERFLASPELLDQLEAAELLQQGLQDLAALEKAQPSPRRQGARTASGIMSLFQSPRYAMAASVLLLISLGVSSHLLRENAQLGEVGTNLVLPAEIVPLVTTRGTSLNTITLDDPARHYVLMLDPGFEAFASHRATVYRLETGAQAQLVWQVDRLQPGYEDMLALSLPGAVLAPGRYEITIEGLPEGTGQSYEQIGTVAFEAQRR